MGVRTARVPVRWRGPLGRAATVATVLLLGAITWLGLPLRTVAAPLGIVSLQFAASPDAGMTMLGSWSEVPRARVLWSHGLDVLLPVAYAVAIVMTATDAALRASTGVRTARTAATAAVAAAVADQVENIAMAATLLAGPTWGSVLVTLVAAIAKYALLAMAVGALIGTLRSASGRRTSRSTP
jgi:hypothetical protein